MKKNSYKTIILIWVVCLLASCAGSKFISKGSQSLRIYEGSFDGVRYGGTIRVHLFKTHEGVKRFRATVALEPNEPMVPSALFVRGKVTANALEGEFQGNATGTFSGRLSSDGNHLSGTFDLISPDLNDGTWMTQKK